MNDPTSKRVNFLVPRLEHGLILLILFIAAWIRIWQIDQVPPGLTHDEANNVHDAAAILDGVRPLIFPVAQGKEPLYLYSVASLMSFLGRFPWVMRLTSALWGMLLVSVVYIWTKRTFGKSTALLTIAILAVGFWPVSTARMGLRGIPLPVLFTLALIFVHRHYRQIERVCECKRSELPKFRHFLTWSWDLFAAGILIGLSFYTYLASRAMPLAIIIFFLYLAAMKRNRKWLFSLAVIIFIALIVSLPLVFYLSNHPSAQIRIDQLDSPIRNVLSGNVKQLVEHLEEAIGIFTIRGDSFVPYNIPGKPIFGPILGLLFYLGLGISLVRWKRPANALLLLWFFSGMIPALVTGVEAANLRIIAAQPPIYVFPALAMIEVSDRFGGFLTKYLRNGNLKASKERISTQLAATFGLLLFIGTGWNTYRDYFINWAQNTDVRAHYHSDLVTIGEKLDLYPGQPVSISALYPGQYHDPRVIEAVMRTDHDRIRWFDGRSALAFPEQTPFILVLPDQVPLQAQLANLISSAGIENTITFGTNDQNQAISIYGIGGVKVEEMSLPARNGETPIFGDHLLLTRLSFEPANFPGDDTLSFITAWKIIDTLPSDRDAVMVVQILSPDGQVIAQQDRLDVPSWSWHPGDFFLQTFSIELPPLTVPGTYRIILAVYTVADRVDAVLSGAQPDNSILRLLVAIDDAQIGDSYEIGTMQIAE